MKSGLLSTVMGVVLASATITVAPPASASMPFGNYELHIPDRRDFHTWVMAALAPCRGENNSKRHDCLNVGLIPRPVAKAAQPTGDANLVDGRYTFTVDDPFGLRCGDIYYGPTIPTHDVYSWDANTLAGEMVSTFDVGCDNAPGGSFTYPFTLTRM
ncbi:hypothetical protein A5699_14715 [Mycobacterium sp. E802]|nr:hypothetical protein A5699_14715 [Mycobacterium sp. E802]